MPAGARNLDSRCAISNAGSSGSNLITFLTRTAAETSPKLRGTTTSGGIKMKLPSWSVIAAIALGLASASPARAQDKPVQLKFSHWVPPTHPMHAAAVAWADSIDKASNGTIKITIFPAQQLGKAFDHYNMARDGIVDISHVNPGYEPGRFPIVGAVELPFIFSNGKEGSARSMRDIAMPDRK
jgi:hypothetical protein